MKTKTKIARPALILTVGHSTRPIEEFIELLRTHEVERLVDVRTVPRSRHNPQFNREALAKSLPASGIAYTHLKALGGLRHARPDSQNMGWRNASFRGYADYMQTPDFERGLDRLLKLAAHKRCAVMCAEAVPWRCHRSLIADALAVKGIPVEHILSAGKRQVHRMTPFARVHDGVITYPPYDDPKAAAPDTPAAAQQELPYNGTIRGETIHGGNMARKKRKRKFTADNEARRQAREAVGTPPAERVIPDKRKKAPKHKKPLTEPLPG